MGWFGGGADLTPYYLFDEDAKDFHQMYKNICDTNGIEGTNDNEGTYSKCKKWCDDYFYLPARGEHRGIGGTFFDDLSSLSSFNLPNVRIAVEKEKEKKIGIELEKDKKTEVKVENVDNSDSNIQKQGQEQQEKKMQEHNKAENEEIELDKAMKFTQAICDTFMPSYLPIAKKRKNLQYTEDQRYWQLLRRGRYIEFNLLYDRGVKFGLVPGGKLLLLFFIFN